jgi:hypothetical protein
MTASKKNLWYASSGVVHGSLVPCADKIMRWSGMDSKQLFEKHCQAPDKKRILEQQGFLDLNCISYSYNHQGFRSDEFDNRPAGIALGCSFTEGVGIPLNKTWPSVLSELLNHHVWNLGVGGSGMDTCFRMLDHYLNILNVKFVVLCSPSPLRFEFFDRYDVPRTFIPMHLDNEKHRDFAKEWMTSDLNTNTQARRNILAMKWRCQEKNIPFFELSFAKHFNKDGLARDLAHPGVEANKKFAHLFYNKVKNVVNSN